MAVNAQGLRQHIAAGFDLRMSQAEKLKRFRQALGVSGKRATITKADREWTKMVIAKAAEREQDKSNG